MTQEATRRVTGPEGGRIVWRAWGDGPTLVLLHGDGGSWTHWIRNIPGLAQRFRLIAPDMPGYGDSDAPAADWTAASLAQALCDGLEEIVAAPSVCAVAGFSFGGIIAGHWASIDRRIDKLVLLGSGGLGLASQHTRHALLRTRPGMDETARRAVHRHNLGALMIARLDSVDDRAVAIQMANLAAARIRAGGIPDTDTLATVLPTIRASLFGIWGERDAFAHPEVAARVALLQRLQPGADVRTIDGAGHWVQYEAAETVNAMLVDMLLNSASLSRASEKMRDPIPG